MNEPLPTTVDTFYQKFMWLMCRMTEIDQQHRRGA